MLTKTVVRDFVVSMGPIQGIWGRYESDRHDPAKVAEYSLMHQIKDVGALA